MEAGLGKMKLVFPNKKAGHNEFQSLEEKFPRLIDGGGIEVLVGEGGDEISILFLREERVIHYLMLGNAFRKLLCTSGPYRLTWMNHLCHMREVLHLIIINYHYQVRMMYNF